MIAPEVTGPSGSPQLRERRGNPGLLAVYQDETGDAKERALAYAKGSAVLAPASSRRASARRPRTDIFGEQAVLCGGIAELIKTGYETLVDAGYSPEMAYFECMNEMKLIVDLMYEGGARRDVGLRFPTPPSTAGSLAATT